MFKESFGIRENRMLEMARILIFADCFDEMTGESFPNDKLPFYIVELADFLAPDDPGRARLGGTSAEQAKAAQSVDHATLIKNSDTGEWNDIHPLDKKTAGTRLVEAVLSAE